MNGSAAFSESYHEARARFRAMAGAAGFCLEAHPIDGDGLTIDVARAGESDPDRLVVVSSGLHGVEGFFGSAVQLALLDGEVKRWPMPRGTGLLLLHALNPFGFAHLRRFDADNIDLNRAFVLPGDAYRGCPSRYAALDPLLNPAHAPRRFDPFWTRSLAAIARHGFGPLKQAVAGGQFAYPRGLFFGGRGPSRLQHWLAEHLPDWVGSAVEVIHLDYHTGLGRWGDDALLIDAPLDPDRQARLDAIFGPARVQISTSNGIAYQSLGGIGPWCMAQFPNRSFTSLCAEFGTYRPLTVLAALRAENQAHHWAPPDAPVTHAARARLLEVFAPADPAWRDRVVARGVDLVRLALAGVSAASAARA